MTKPFEENEKILIASYRREKLSAFFGVARQKSKIC